MNLIFSESPSIGEIPIAKLCNFKGFPLFTVSDSIERKECTNSDILEDRTEVFL